MPATVKDTDRQEALAMGARLHRSLERLWWTWRPADRDVACCRGLTPNQASLLRLLCESKKGMLSMGALAADLSLSPNGVTRCADPLVDRGLVERVFREDDRRVCCLRATRAGARLRGLIARDSAAREARRLQRIPPEERETILRALEHLARAGEENP